MVETELIFLQRSYDFFLSIFPKVRISGWDAKCDWEWSSETDVCANFLWYQWHYQGIYQFFCKCWQCCSKERLKRGTGLEGVPCSPREFFRACITRVPWILFWWDCPRWGCICEWLARGRWLLLAMIWYPRSWPSMDQGPQWGCWKDGKLLWWKTCLWFFIPSGGYQGQFYVWCNIVAIPPKSLMCRVVAVVDSICC